MKRPCVLLTRPLEESKLLAKRLEKAGFNTLIEPMITIKTLTQAHKPLLAALDGKMQGILTTSKQAIRALSKLTTYREAPLYTLGTASAAKALKAGFRDIKIAEGGARALYEYVLTHARPEAGKFLYARGRDVTLDLAKLLNKHGFLVEPVIVYEVAAATFLSPTLIKKLQDGSLGAVLFFSQRTAEIFMHLATQYGLTKHLKSLNAYCFSEAIAKKLPTEDWRRVNRLPKPNINNILKLLNS